MGYTQKYIIVKDRVEIYRDFAINLLYYIYDYYIDRESLSDDSDIRNHFIWCFNKVCDEFKEEDINFSENKELKEYFFAFYYHQFYKLVGNMNQNTSIEYYKKFWNSVFDIDKQKNKSILNIFIEIYNIYDKSVNKEKNILEII